MIRNDATLRTTLDPELQEWASGRLLSKIREDARPPTTSDKRPGVSAGDLAQDVARVWNTDASVRAEFRELAVYSAFRHGIADGTIRGYDANGEKLMRTDPVTLAIRQADEEDRSAGVDPRLSVEARARQVWGLNRAVRQEFGDNVETYIAWRRRAERSRA